MFDDNGCPITPGIETQESFDPEGYTPSACGNNLAEWANTDHPTPGQRNDDPTYAFYIDNSVLCAPGDITICAEIYNYQHISDNMDIGSGTDNMQTGSYVFNPITNVNETWDTYVVSGETTTLCKTVNITEVGAYEFGAVIDDYSNSYGTTNNPHEQSSPNECYETQNFLVTLVEPAMYDCNGDGIADNPQVPCALSCDPGPPTPGLINVTNHIVGGGNLQYQLIDNSGILPTVTNTSGIFNIPDDATANTGYRIDILEMANCGFGNLSISIDDNCEKASICPESISVTVDGGAGPIMTCPDTQVELCFDGNQLPSGGDIVWEVNDGSGFSPFATFEIPANTPDPFVYISDVLPDPAGTSSVSIALCGSRTEWVVLTNADSANPVDISGYQLEDGPTINSFHTIAAGTIIPAGGTYVVCVGSTSRLANGGDLVNLRDASGDLISNVTWTSNPGDDTSAGSDTPPVVIPADPAYDSTPADKEFCAFYTISSESCPIDSLQFRAVIEPFSSSCPETNPDANSANSDTLQVVVSCPTAVIIRDVFDEVIVCDQVGRPIMLPVTITGGVGPYTLVYTLDGDTFTEFGISSGDHIVIDEPTDGEVKLIFDSITDEAGAFCTGSVSDVEICVNLIPTQEFTVTGSTQPTACAPCDGCLLYTSPSPRDATLSRMPSSA